jgi:hypothetical protein
MHFGTYPRIFDIPSIVPIAEQYWKLLLVSWDSQDFDTLSFVFLFEFIFVYISKEYLFHSQNK